MGLLFLLNADWRKYGSIKNELAASYTRGRDEYPDSLKNAIDYLDTHVTDTAYKEYKKKQRQDKGSESKSKSETSFAQKSENIQCYCCGDKSHKCPDCPLKDKVKRNDWFKKTGVIPKLAKKNFAQAEEEEEGDESDDDDNSTVTSVESSRTTSSRKGGKKKKGWSNFMIQPKQFLMSKDEKDELKYSKSKLNDVIILDTGSTIPATIANPDFITNLKTSDELLRMATNAGTKELNLKGEVIGFGDAWYDPDFMANIFSFSHMKSKYRITYDSKRDDAFHVHTDNGIVKFGVTDEGLYAYKPTKQFLKEVAKTKNKVLKHTFVATVKDNIEGYSKNEVDGARRARKLYHAIGCPTIENLKHIIRMNLIRNCPVTTEDINNAERIWGADIGALKGKTTRAATAKVFEDIVEIPPELKRKKNIVLCIDIMYVHGIPMLTAIDKSIRHRALVPMDNRESKELFESIDVILRYYNKAGYKIKSIHCDQEFRPIMDRVSDDLDIEMNYATTDEHVPEAERNNRTIKERIRATFHNMPFKRIPKVMIKELSMRVTHLLNIFPAKGGISSYYSPYTILSGKSIDYEKELSIPFGAYVQGSNEPKPSNTNAPRTLDCIYLGPVKSKQGGHKLMDISTGKVITRRRVKELPMTDIVIRAVEQMAKKQGIKSLKFTTRDGVPFEDADWIEEVDGAEDDNDENESDSDESESDSDSDDDSSTSSSDSDTSDDNDELDDDMDEIDRLEVEDLLAEARNEADAESNPANIPEQPPNNDIEVQQEVENVHPAGVSVSDVSEDSNELRRSGRERQPPERYNPETGLAQMEKPKSVKIVTDNLMKDLEYCHNMTVEKHPDKYIEYDSFIAGVAARHIHYQNEKACLGPQYILQKGLKKFGAEGIEAATKEMKQLHDRTCFKPILVSELTDTEMRKAQEALMFLTEKRDQKIKGRTVYNGKPTREWHDKEDAASPTASLESIYLTAIIDAKENRDVMTSDIPNAFIQASMPVLEKGEDRVIMKVKGALLEILVSLAPELYGPYVVQEKGKRVIYLEVLRALYGMLVAALLWYRQLRKDLEEIGFKFNPYDPCVANRRVNKKRQTVRFHVDDLMSSHVDSTVNDEFLKWMNEKYGKHGAVTATRGNIHEYLGMTFDFTNKGKVVISMAEYMSRLVDEFPHPITKKAKSPAAEDLFGAGNGKSLDKEQAKVFHTWVAKALFACKRARPDIHVAVTLLCTRVRDPNEDDWKKLIRLLEYINGTRDDVLTLSADDLHVIKWYVDASFAVHADFKSHTGAIMSYGNGAAMTMSRKQKLNTRSSTEAELVGVDDAVNMILWTKLFLSEQGYHVEKNTVYQDNKSAILLERNGKKSSSKRTRAINIRYFFITDQVEKGNVNIEYCPTGEMLADFMTKPLQGKLFAKFKKSLMGA